jgi:hypothetical protein
MRGHASSRSRPSVTVLKFTGSAELHRKLAQAQELLSHSVPRTLATWHSSWSALDKPIHKELKRRTGAGKKRKRDTCSERNSSREVHSAHHARQAAGPSTESQGTRGRAAAQSSPGSADSGQKLTAVNLREFAWRRWKTPVAPPQTRWAFIASSTDFSWSRKLYRMLRCARTSLAFPAGGIPAPARSGATPPRIEPWAYGGNDMS